LALSIHALKEIDVCFKVSTVIPRSFAIGASFGLPEFMISAKKTLLED